MGAQYQHVILIPAGWLQNQTYHEVMTIVTNRTTGRFYYTPSAICFEDEKDAVIFKLSYNAPGLFN